MTRKFKHLATIVGSIVLSALNAMAHAHDTTAKATYLGNEAILVTDGESNVLFDAFYNDDYDTYTLVPEEIQDDLLTGRSPYNNIRILFVSHVHGDHFTAEEVIKFMRTQQSVEVYGPKEIVAALLSAGVKEEDSILNRVHTFDLAFGESTDAINLGPLIAEALSVPHSGNFPDIRNLIWRVTHKKGTTIAHFGDANPSKMTFASHKAFFRASPIDTAFVPYWFYRTPEGNEILADIVDARSIMGFHLPDAARQDPDKWREAINPNIFIEPGETVRVHHHD